MSASFVRFFNVGWEFLSIFDDLFVKIWVAKSVIDEYLFGSLDTCIKVSGDEQNSWDRRLYARIALFCMPE